MNLEIRLLGTLAANLDGRPVDLGGPRQRAVLALLLVARGAAVSVDRLIEDLWQGEAPQRATASLQVYVSNLRRALEPGRPPRAPARVLVSAPPGYAIRLDDDAVDAWRFENLVRAAADATSPFDAIATLEEALRLWRGAAYAEFAADPWAAPEATRLEDLRWVARERLVDARIRAGRPAEAVVEAEALVRDAELREEGWRLLALAQYLAGRQADSLATLRRARRLLSDELGIDPGPRLRRPERDGRGAAGARPPTNSASPPGRGSPLSSVMCWRSRSPSRRTPPQLPAPSRRWTSRPTGRMTNCPTGGATEHARQADRSTIRRPPSSAVGRSARPSPKLRTRPGPARR